MYLCRRNGIPTPVQYHYSLEGLASTQKLVLIVLDASENMRNIKVARHFNKMIEDVKDFGFKRLHETGVFPFGIMLGRIHFSDVTEVFPFLFLNQVLTIPSECYKTGGIGNLERTIGDAVDLLLAKADFYQNVLVGRIVIVTHKKSIDLKALKIDKSKIASLLDLPSIHPAFTKRFDIGAISLDGGDQQHVASVLGFSERNVLVTDRSPESIAYAFSRLSYMIKGLITETSSDYMF